MNVLKRVVLCAVILAAAAGAGCARAQAKVVPEMPALDVPAPPPRQVETVEVDEEPEPPVVEPQEPARPAPPKPARATPVQQRADQPKPEPPKVDVTAPPEAPRPAEESKPGTLQTTPAAREAQLERTIRGTLQRATASLNRVTYGSLNADARMQYDQARRFVSQAQDALRDKNLVFAENLADKANTLATQLAGR
jgi:outer membrane biosynthesis protein TonB